MPSPVLIVSIAFAACRQGDNVMTRISVVCGSMRWYNQTLALANELTYEGNIVLLPFVLKVDNPSLDKDLQALHREKIDMADTVYIFKGEKMGESTAEEYKYAKSKSKTIYVYDGFPFIGSQNDWREEG